MPSKRHPFLALYHVILSHSSSGQVRTARVDATDLCTNRQAQCLCTTEQTQCGCVVRGRTHVTLDVGLFQPFTRQTRSALREGQSHRGAALPSLRVHITTGKLGEHGSPLPE